MSSKTETGQRAEDAACRYLEQHGLRLVERNYQGPRGEIDLIMRDQRTTVFVEVRYRRSQRFGSGAESVDRRKQDKLLATAALYLQRHPQAAKTACRFDVVSLGSHDGRDTVDWITDAFQA
jgi:putative endonuclease